MPDDHDHLAFDIKFALTHAPVSMATRKFVRAGSGTAEGMIRAYFSPAASSSPSWAASLRIAGRSCGKLFSSSSIRWRNCRSPRHLADRRRTTRR